MSRVLVCPPTLVWSRPTTQGGQGSLNYVVLSCPGLGWGTELSRVRVGLELSKVRVGLELSRVRVGLELSRVRVGHSVRHLQHMPSCIQC